MTTTAVVYAKIPTQALNMARTSSNPDKPIDLKQINSAISFLGNADSNDTTLCIITGDSDKHAKPVMPGGKIEMIHIAQAIQHEPTLRGELTVNNEGISIGENLMKSAAQIAVKDELNEEIGLSQNKANVKFLGTASEAKSGAVDRDYRIMDPNMNDGKNTSMKKAVNTAQAITFPILSGASTVLTAQLAKTSVKDMKSLQADFGKEYVGKMTEHNEVFAARFGVKDFIYGAELSISDLQSLGNSDQEFSKIGLIPVLPNSKFNLGAGHSDILKKSIDVIQDQKQGPFNLDEYTGADGKYKVIGRPSDMSQNSLTDLNTGETINLK